MRCGDVYVCVLRERESARTHSDEYPILVLVFMYLERTAWRHPHVRVK